MATTSSIAFCALCFLSLAVLGSANGPNLETDKYGKACKASQNCYEGSACRKKGGKIRPGFRDCYFDCLWKKVKDEPNGYKFFKQVQKAADFCEEKRENSDNENKVMKCTVKKVKKDLCENYYGGIDKNKQNARDVGGSAKKKAEKVKSGLKLPKWIG